jgi:alcohol dehydrogenase class IV
MMAAADAPWSGPDFTYTALPGRVLFGAGTLARLPEEVDRLGCRRALVLCTPQQEATGQSVAALLVAREHDADCTVAVGGGSTTGLGKAIALRTDLPQLVVPTTYAGSEMTPILGETEGARKTTQRSPKVLPEVVIYDVDLTLGLPPGLSATSGVNAIAHAVEALYAQDANPIITIMAEQAIGALAQALPRIVATPADRPARRAALYGAWLAGACLGAVGMALHHKLCHVLGGSFGLPHAETHTVVLPHAVAYNRRAAPQAMTRLAAALGAGEPAVALFDLSGRLSAPRALRELGMAEAAIAQAADQAVQNAYWNPRPLDRTAIERLIRRAWAGEAPAES